MKKLIACFTIAAVIVAFAFSGQVPAQVDGNYLADYGYTHNETLTMNGAASDTSEYIDIRPMPHLAGRLAAIVTSASNDSGVAYNIEASLDRTRWFTMVDSTRGIPDGSNVSRKWDWETAKLYRYWRALATNTSADTVTVRIDWVIK